MNYELCNHIIVRPFKGDEFLWDDYCDGIRCGNRELDELNHFEARRVKMILKKIE